MNVQFPINNQPNKRKVRWYFDNLLRLRYWWFTFAGSLLIVVIVGLIFPPIATIAPIIFILMGTFWLTVQMACRNCGRMFAAGGVKDRMVCAHCNTLTDAGIDSQS